VWLPILHSYLANIFRAAAMCCRPELASRSEKPSFQHLTIDHGTAEGRLTVSGICRIVTAVYPVTLGQMKPLGQSTHSRQIARNFQDYSP
jgi:hypothetical protein